MNLSYLRTFVYVAELESFSKAAEALNLTQPAVSFQIHGLEKAYQEVLFDRSSQQIRLTDAGKIFLKYARDILKLNDALSLEIADLRDLVRGQLFVGASNIPGEYILPHLLGEFKEAHPQVNIKLEVMDTKEVISRLLSHKLDVGFCGAASKRVPIIYEDFATDELVIAMPAGHPLAAKNNLRLNDLKKHRFVMREEGSATRQIFKEAIEARGVLESDLNIALELGSTQAVLSAVAGGIGITPVSVFAINNLTRADSITFGKVADLNLKRKLFIAYNEKSPMSKAQSAFIEHVKSRRDHISTLTEPPEPSEIRS